MAQPASDPINQMMDLVLAYCRSQGLGAVARLGVPDLLQAGPRTAADLASELGCHAEALDRFLSALSVEGVFTRESEGRYGLTPLSEGLTSEHPRSLRWFAAAMCDHPHWAPWGRAFDVIRDGTSQTEAVLGTGPWAYLADHPEEAERFARAMTNMSQQAMKGIREHYDFAGIEHLVDVGGSEGTLLLEILEAHPTMRGTVFDLPNVVERTRANLEGHALADRIELVGGSFFESVPAGADAYMLKHILHDWPDAKCRTILESIRHAIPPEGRVIVFDALLVPEAPAWAHWLDVHMLVLQDGKERSPDAFAALFAEAGFELTRATPIPAPVAIIEARPV